MLLVGFVITTAATSGVVPGSSPVGHASAEMVNCDGSASNYLGGAWFNTILGNTEGCHWSDNTDYENLTATNAYSSALALKDATDSYTTTTQNFMANARTVAMSKAKITMVNELNNGASRSQAKFAVNQTVRDYYSRVQVRILSDWDAKVTQIASLDNQSDQTIGYYYQNERNGEWYSGGETLGTNTIQFELVNGTSVDTEEISLRTLPSGSRFHPGGSSDPPKASPIRVVAVEPNSSEETRIFESQDYGSLGSWANDQNDTYLLDETQEQTQQVLANMDPYVDEVSSQYQAGEINSSDLAMMDPSTIGAEASTSLKKSGYYGQGAAMLASTGASGDINASHTIAVGDGSGNPTVLNGTLFYTGDDASGGWDTGQTYRFSDYNGTFYMAVQDGANGTIVDLSTYGSQFEILEAVNTRTGETMNTTSPHKYLYNSTNASSLADEIEQLRQLRRQYETTGTGGGGGGGGFGVGTEDRVIIVAAIVALILVSTRN